MIQTHQINSNQTTREETAKFSQSKCWTSGFHSRLQAWLGFGSSGLQFDLLFVAFVCGCCQGPCVFRLVGIFRLAPAAQHALWHWVGRNWGDLRLDLWMLAVLQLECCAAHISVGLMIPPGFHGTSMDVAGKWGCNWRHLAIFSCQSNSLSLLIRCIPPSAGSHHCITAKWYRQAPLPSMNRTLNGGISSNPGLGPRKDRRKEGWHQSV